MRKIFENYKVVLIFMLVYWCICFAMLFQSGDFLYAALSWNVLLAICPLFFIGKAVESVELRKTGWSIFWLIPWLFFFPNSVYLITDFIHIANEKFRWVIEVEKYTPGAGVVYSDDMMIWAKLLVIGMGFFFSILVGLESVYIFEQIIRKRYSRMIGYATIFGVALLTGIGVYIGRFLRFNSWDILFNPLQLFKQVMKIDGFAIQFMIAFTIFVVGSYIVYRVFRKQSTLII